MSLLVCFYAGAIVTSLFKQTLQQGKELLVYATIYGTIGSLTPIASIETLETVVALESIIIGKGISLVGRNVDDYRSLFLWRRMCHSVSMPHDCRIIAICNRL